MNPKDFIDIIPNDMRHRTAPRKVASKIIAANLGCECDYGVILNSIEKLEPRDAKSIRLEHVEVPDEIHIVGKKSITFGEQMR